MTLLVGGTVRASGVPVDVALDLLAQLPADIPVRVRPDYAQQFEAAVHAIHPPGYFGLTVALARETWKQ